MGRGRARAAAVGVLGVLALAVSGCGAETHPNEQRPQVPIRASITITPKAVTVQPVAIGVGPARTQQIPQNQNHPQPPIRSDRGPLIIVLVAANQTTTDSRLEIRGPRDIHSGPIFAHSSGTLQTALPTGNYVISAADIPGARPGKLTVGPYRASSQNDVLLP
jgi:hypothetical protein